jgi:nitroreductase
MSIKQFIKHSDPVVFLRILSAKIYEAWIATKYLDTAGMMSNPRKLATDLHIRAHALEKGMSIGNGRKGFGIPKALSLIKDIDLYFRLGGGNDNAAEWCGILTSYIRYNQEQKADVSIVEQRLHSLLEKYNIQPDTQGNGILWFDHEEIRKKERTAFAEFSQSRYSIRDFGTAPVSKVKLEDAFKLCERTPSACNRQSVRLHVFTDRDKIDHLCRMQQGCKGFYEDFQGVIMVCSDMTCYSFHEANQYYVDGGLYAMNLMYALHANDIASIPLTMGHKARYLSAIKKRMGIPANEQPILLIGYGSYKDKWKVAASKRRSWMSYVSWNS